MRIYIATPVNARKEATLEEKRKAANERVCELAEMLKQKFPGAEFHSSFDWDIAPLGCHCVKDEPQIMGMCVRRVMECDMVFLDEGWKESKGCVVEFYTADTYGKKIQYNRDEPERWKHITFEKAVEIARENPISWDMTYEERLAALKSRVGL